MADPDTKNAHIRSENTRRESPEVAAEEADFLLNHPAFKRGMDTLMEGTVNVIVNLQHDGSPEADAAEREACRTLRCAHSLRRLIKLSVQGQQLRLADFQSREQG